MRPTLFLQTMTMVLLVPLGRVGDVASGEDARGVGITGVVRNRATGGREAGVWVIAETHSLPAVFRRIVVTDDQGRFLVPALPDGRYDLWVRGYGLRDSDRIAATPGIPVRPLVDSASPPEAARIYPANYWLALFEPPARSELPTGFENQNHWLTEMKLGCIRCHQFGSPIVQTRTHPQSWEELWLQRPGEGTTADALGRNITTKALSTWAARIARGDVPPAPARPSGIERNVVITQWDWGGERSYIHDIISTDKRRPTLYANGRIWGVDFGSDQLWWLDPRTHQTGHYPVPTTNVLNRPAPAVAGAVVYNNPANPHVLTLDDRGRVWIATQTRRERPEDTPVWVRAVLDNVQATDGSNAIDLLPIFLKGTHHRQLVFFDTAAERFVTIDTAYGTNHLQLDRDDRLWTSGDSVSLGMLDTKRLDPRKPRETEASAQKAFLSIDRAGKSAGGGGYGIAVNYKDGTVWRTNTYIGQTGAPDNRAMAGQNTIVKFDSVKRTFTSYSLPPPGRSAIGIDVGADGRVWFGTASGHLGRFDAATERFTYWATPGPRITVDNNESQGGDFHYNVFVDQYDTSGLGAGTVILTGANSDALVVFDPRSERFSIFRVPYPLVMYHRGIDGRIDDPQAGWKGRGLWITDSNDPARFIEHGMGVVSHIQLRPHPLAY